MDLSIPDIEFEKFAQDVLANNPRFIDQGTLELTYRCNLDCVHCYCNCGSLLRREKELKTKEVFRLLDEIADQGCIWLAFTGGEPLVREDFIDIYLYAKKKGFIVTILSNGTLIDDKMVCIFNDFPPQEVEISLYGITEYTYEQVSRVAGSFRKCMKAIEALRKKGVALEIKTIVLRMNSHEVVPIGDFARRIGAKFRYDPLIHSRLDHDASPCAFRLTPHEIASLDSDMEQMSGYFREKYASCRGQTVDCERLFTCGAGHHAFSIDPFGNLKTCVFPGRYQYDLRKGSFRQGWNDFLPRVVNRKRKNGSFICQKCQIRLLCNQCPQWAYLEYRDEEKIVDYLCAVNKERAKKFAAAPTESEVGYEQG